MGYSNEHGHGLEPISVLFNCLFDSSGAQPALGARVLMKTYWAVALHQYSTVNYQRSVIQQRITCPIKNQNATDLKTIRVEIILPTIHYNLRRPTLFNHIFYKEFRNKLHSLMRRVEREYYDKELFIHRNSLRKSWEIMKEVINPKQKIDMPDRFNIGGATITDKYAIAQQFNDFYVNIGNNLSTFAIFVVFAMFCITMHFVY